MGYEAGRHSLCSVLGGMEPGSFQTCIQYNIFDESEGTQERKMECEIADRTLIEVKWQVWTRICQKCNTLKNGSGLRIGQKCVTVRKTDPEGLQEDL